jgi:hypothetical protein
MMEKQISKKKLERMAILGGDFRKAGSRSKGEFKTEAMNELLESDVKDLQSKGTDVESIRIADDKEFERIMNRNRLFGEGKDAIPTEGKMYDTEKGYGYYECVNDERAPFFLMHRNRRIEILYQTKISASELFIIAK